MFTNSSRSHIERHRSIGLVRNLDDHMLRQLGLSQVHLVAIQYEP